MTVLGKYLVIQKNEIHLDKNEDHLEERPDQDDHVLALLQVEADLEEDADLDARVDHAANPEH